MQFSGSNATAASYYIISLELSTVFFDKEQANKRSAVRNCSNNFYILFVYHSSCLYEK